MSARTTWQRFVPAMLAVIALALPAHAQVSTRTMGVTWHEGAPDVSFSAADFADATVRRQFSRGLLQTIVMRTYAYGQGHETPIAVAVRSCQVVYDIWEARYTVDVRTEASDRTSTFDDVDDVVTACLVADHVVVGDTAAWRPHHGAHVRFAVVVELNPVTPDMVERIRGWLARPEGGAARDDTAFFGSFVQLFVTRQIGDAERTLRFGSQELLCP
jgi:hypothetical protein